jgi:diguanylate cyclase (GGDEF)-like protein
MEKSCLTEVSVRTRPRHNAMVTIAETILDAIRALKIPHELSTVSDNLTVSIGGINFVPQSHSHIEDAIVLAEDMLYHAKESGRNRFVKVANHLI